MDSAELKKHVSAYIESEKMIYELSQLIQRMNTQISRLDLTRHNQPQTKKERKPKELRLYYYKELHILVCCEDLYPNRYIINGYDKDGKLYWIKECSKTLFIEHEEKDYDSDPKIIKYKTKDIRSHFRYDIQLKPPGKYSESVYEYVLPDDFKEVFKDACRRAEMRAKEKVDAENAKIEKYNKGIREEKERFDKAESLRLAKQQLKKQMIECDIQTYEQSLAEVQKSLSELKKMNIIHEKFSSLSHLCCIYDLLDTKICSQLEGDGGAYEKCLLTLRHNEIIDSLARIEGKLDSVLEGQAMLQKTYKDAAREISDTIDRNMESMESTLQSGFSSVSKGISDTNSILGDTNSILKDYRENSVATRFNTEKIRKISEYTLSVKRAKGEYIGFDYTYPN